MSSKYVDTTAIIQVIGCTFKKQSILDQTDVYNISEEDFTEKFHKIVFGCIHNIHLTKSKVTLEAIVDYLALRPKAEAVFKANNGIEYIKKAAESAQENTFNYYYQRLKKMTLLRAYDNYGFDVSNLYDPDEVLDIKKRQQQEDWLDTTPITEIAAIIDRKIEDIKTKYLDKEAGYGYLAAEGMDELVEQFKRQPEVGIPLYGNLINTVTRGARLRKFYLRSAATGLGKTRTIIADACNFACNKIYTDDFGWMKNGNLEPTLVIVTEQDRSEVQTMMIAFLSNVNEEHIINGEYLEGEEERVKEAIKVFKSAPLWVEELPDFSLLDVENTIKRHIREHNVKYVCSN